jgi:lysophospholipase L1-like esterase
MGSEINDQSDIEYVDPGFEDVNVDAKDGGGTDAGQGDLREEERIGEMVGFEPEPLARFLEALRDLDRSDREMVRVLHYGDSHIAADFLTTAIRRSLQARFGDGGRGFVLLGRPWRSYRPKDVSLRTTGVWRTERILVAADPATLDGRYGLGGVSTNSGEQGASSWVGTRRGTDFGRKASTLQVFYLQQPGGGSFQVIADGRVRGKVNTASGQTRSGFFTLAVTEGEHEFGVRLLGDGEVRFFGAVIESDGPGLVYDTLGINGGFFYTPLRWDGDLLAEQVAQRDPDLLVTMYGANEVDSKSINPENYKAKVLKVMARFAKGAPDADCLMLGPTDRKIRQSNDDSPDQLSWIIDVQREVADEIGCAFMDLRQMMGGPGSQEMWSRMSPALAQPDGIHLTVRGYRDLGERIAAELLCAYEGRFEGRPCMAPHEEE